MRKLPLLITIGCLILLGSCNDQEEIVPPVLPTANFDFEGPYGSPLFPTLSGIEIIDKSTNGDTYLWDFGNGETSTEKAPIFWYPTSGTYTITLTVTSSTGEKSTATKSIKIVDRVLETIEIKHLNWNGFGNFQDWPDDKAADVYVEILRGGNSYYKSPIITGISESDAPLTISVNEKVIISPTDIMTNLVVRLIAIDDGKENIIYDSSWAGFFAFGNHYSFEVRTGIEGTNIYLYSGYQ